MLDCGRLQVDTRSVYAVTSDSMSEIIQETKRLISLRHYSCSAELDISTERTNIIFANSTERMYEIEIRQKDEPVV
jgi:hypothetical protein